MWTIDPPPNWVGRGEELAVVRAGVEALSRGEGSLIWVEGEPGIGKSSLVAEALAAGSAPGWDIGWGIAGQLTERLPLRVMLDCLQIRPGSPDPRRAHAADVLRRLRQGLFADGDASATGIELLVGLVDELSAAAPAVIVLDDLQWADDASLIVWHQLAASIGQLRLLLIGPCRPTPRRAEVQELRAAAIRHGGAVVTLGPLTETDVTALVTAMLGSPPGDTLRQLTAQAAGNPLYVRELVDAMVREHVLEFGPAAEVAAAGERLPASLAAVLTDRLSSVSAGTEQLLRTAALLGGRFAVTDLAVVMRRPASVRGHRPGRGNAPTSLGAGGRRPGGGGSGHLDRFRAGPGVPSSADPAGALREHAGRAADGSAHRSGQGTSDRRRGRAERRTAAVRREQAG